MSELTASGHFAGGASADLHSLTRAIELGGNRLRHAHLKRRQWTVPEDWFERLTDQSGRFAAVGSAADERAVPEPFADMPDGEEALALPDITDFELQQPLIAEAPAAQKPGTFWFGGSLASVAIHGLCAVLFLTFGLHVDLPQVEGETAVAVTIVGNAAFDELASGDDAGGPAEAELTPLVPPAGPEIPKPGDFFEPVEIPVALPAPRLRAPVEPTLPPLSLMTTMHPAKASVSLEPELPKPVEAKPPVVESQVEPAKKTEPERKAKAEPVKKPEPIAKVALKTEKTKKVRTPKPAVAKAKTVVKTSSNDVAARPVTTKAKSAKATGKAGSGKADSRKGAADGAEKGQSTSQSAGKSAGKTGNATASNYPGLVQRKISRTRKKSGGGKGNVVISFSITSSGGLGAVSVARSSGTSSVDAAALDHVRRSAPFPAPPAGAQTRFRIPVTIR